MPTTIDPRSDVMSPLSIEKGAAPILVATDGMETTDGAFAAAKLLAESTGAAVHVITAIEPQVPLVPSAAMIAAPLDLSDSFSERRTFEVREQLARVVGPTAEWPTEIRFGKPASVIAEAARRHRAGVVVTGLNHHDLLLRLVAGDTPVQVARLVDVPVLAVPPGFVTFPKTVVIAVDLTTASTRAAAAARPLVRTATTIHLVHVKPRAEIPTDGWHDLEREYEDATRVAFANARRVLELPADVPAVTARRMGTPAREILRFAQTWKADLIVTGHTDRSFLDRALGGSVAARLYRGTTCAILIVPDRTMSPDAVASRRAETESATEPERWPAILREFTNRNASRRVTLEIDDAELGAQAAARDYPFLGADYDAKDETIEIMLGDFGPNQRHLTHIVRKPTSVDVLRDSDGSDRVLHIAREGGQTLVKIER